MDKNEPPDVLSWLMQMTSLIAELHCHNANVHPHNANVHPHDANRPRRPQPESNLGPRHPDAHGIEWAEEGFSRWMGWRGQEGHDQETSWPADQLRNERNARIT